MLFPSDEVVQRAFSHEFHNDVYQDVSSRALHQSAELTHLGDLVKDVGQPDNINLDTQSP